MTTWLLLNSLGLVAVCTVLYLVLRQLGYVLHRVGPVGARSAADGPRVGENLAHYLPEILEGDFRGSSKLIVFVSEECSICTAIREGAEELAKSWKRDSHILLVYDCPDEQHEGVVKNVAPGLSLRRSSTLRQALGANFVPFGIATDQSGIVVGKGLVNEIGHLESLLELERANSIEVSHGGQNVSAPTLNSSTV